MSLQDRSNGSNFKTRGSGESPIKPFSISGGGGSVTPPLNSKLFRYALDQSTLIQRFMDHHVPMGWDTLLPIEKYSSIQVSSDRKTIQLELDLDDTEYTDSLNFKESNLAYLVILEAVNVEDTIINGIINNTLPLVELAFETDNTSSNAWEGLGLTELMFDYLGVWYFAIPRSQFRSVSGFRTNVNCYLTVEDSVYMSSNLAEYISIKNRLVEELGDFDYAVIRYIWTAQGGRDLDTRTRITTPPRNVDVGWRRAPSDLPYLTWGGDNTADGVEAVLIDVKSLIANYASIPEFIIALKAFWYSQAVSGAVKIEFASYKGGTMQQSGYNFVNSGGIVVQTLSINNTTLVQKSDDLDGEQLATIYFNPVDKTGRLVIEETGKVELLAFDNVTATPDANGGKVVIEFDNPESNGYRPYLRLWRRTSPFSSGVPNALDAVADYHESLTHYTLTDTSLEPGTYYYAMALTNGTSNIPISPIAYVSVVLGEDYAPVSNVVITVEDI